MQKRILDNRFKGDAYDGCAASGIEHVDDYCVLLPYHNHIHEIFQKGICLKFISEPET